MNTYTSAERFAADETVTLTDSLVGPTPRVFEAPSYSPKALGPKYPPHDASAPVFESEDVAGLLAAVVITLGPLAAYASGVGL